MANGLQQISGITSPTTSSFVDAVAASGALMGAAGMNENHKAYKQARDIHDITGQKLAALGGLEMGMFAMGSTADAATRVFSAVQEVGLAIHNPVVFGAAAATAVAVLTLAGTLLYGLFYLFCAVRLVSLGASWVRGRAWRQELSKEHRPVEALFRQLKERLNKIDVKDAAEIGIKAGAKWLAKVEKESGGKLNIPDKEAAFQKLIQKHPDILEGLIGQSQSPGELLERFGQYIAYQQECAKFEAECARKLGSKAVEGRK
jgi:hypothetical protein